MQASGERGLWEDTGLVFLGEWYRPWKWKSALETLHVVNVDKGKTSIRVTFGMERGEY